MVTLYCLCQQLSKSFLKNSVYIFNELAIVNSYTIPQNCWEKWIILLKEIQRKGNDFYPFISNTITIYSNVSVWVGRFVGNNFVHLLFFKWTFVPFLCRTYVLFWGHWYPCFGFLVTSPLGFQSQSGFCLIHHIAEANVMYIPGDPPLVLHIADLLMVSIVGCWPGSYLAQGYYQ